MNMFTNKVQTLHRWLSAKELLATRIWLGIAGLIIILLLSDVTSAQITAPSNDFVLDNRDLVIRDSADRVRIRLDAQSGDIRVFDTDGNTVTLIEEEGRNMWLGGNGRAGDLILMPRDATGQNLEDASVHINGADGQIVAGQMASTHEFSAADGIDTASVYVESSNPAIGLLDNTGGNEDGWVIQAGRAGNLVFNSGGPNEVGGRIFELQPDGTVCIGACD